VTSAGSLAASQDEATAWSYSLSATGDAPITYALASGSTLPSGISLAANGVVSGTLSSPPGTETTYTFSVVATDAQNQDSTRQFTVSTTSAEGVLFANNVLLIHADGTNNKNNHTFLDSSNNNFTITRNGNATQGSFSPFSQTGWSNFFDGTGDYLSQSGANGQYAFGTGAFTVEFWMYAFSVTNRQSLYTNNTQTLGTGPVFAISGSGTTGRLGVGSVGNVDNVQTANDAIAANAWYHIALVREGTGANQTKIYVNGVQQAVGTLSDNYSVSRECFIGATIYYGEHFNGYLSNVRIVKGTAVYTTNFTPSTTPLTAISNTSLLTCQSNRFIDNSNNNFTITRNGDTSIQAFAPFAPTAAYSTANVGGSGYFDGTGDYLTVPAGSAFAPGTGDFTIEAWVYPTTNSIDQYIWTQTVSGTNYFLFQISSTAILIMTASGGGTPGISGPASSIKPYAWNHVAAVRSGGTVTVYVNGVAGTPGANALDLTNTSYVPTIGTYTHNTSASPLNGYLASLRYVKGTAVYTSAFTPPTAPLTNIANTSFLCNFTNAGIFDQTAKTVLETVGDAKVSTSVYKYGTGSMYFDGTGDYLKVPSAQFQNFAFGTGDFTIECWLYQIAFSSDMVIAASFSSWAATVNFYFGTRAGTPNILIFRGGNGIPITLNGNTGITTSTWTHVAVCRAAGVTRMFVGGVAQANTHTGSNNISATTQSIGIGAANDGTEPMNGYLDDLRVTKGYARYTSNFTPPSSAFKDR
jgi:hypothetical protein